MNKKITMSELVDILALKQNSTKREAENFLKELMALMTETISSGETLRINGLGVFKPVWVEERASVNVQTGEPTVIPGHYKLTFTPAKSVREAINEPFACFCVEELPDDAPLVSDVNVVDEMGDDANDDEVDALQIEPVEEKPVVQEPQPIAEPEIAPVVEHEPEVPVSMTDAEEPLSIENESAEEAQVIEEVTEVAEAVEEVAEVASVEDTPTAPAEPEDVTQDGEQPAEVSQPSVDDAQESLSKAYHRGIWIGVVVSLSVFLLAFALLFFCFPQWTKPFMGVGDTADTTAVVTIPLEVPSDTATLALPDSVAVDTDTLHAELQQLVAPAVVDTIRRGVFLTNISYKHYGHKAFWVYIYEENSHIIANPDNVPVGTVITIPAAEKYGIDANDTTAINVALEKAAIIKQRMKQ